MNQPDQWRFQWPDGTWIRWNPQTQTWEKEAPGQEGVVDVLEAEAEPAPPPVEIVKSRRERRAEAEPEAEPELAPEPEVEPESEPELEAEPEVVTDEAALDVVRDAKPEAEPEPDKFEVEDEPIVADSTQGAHRRSTGRDVLPPVEEPDRPGGSLWPTILTGIVVGVGVGLLLWNLIR